MVDQVLRRAARGARRADRVAELQQHLRIAAQSQLIADQLPGKRILQRLGVQAGEHPRARGVQQQALQRLPGTQPVGAAVGGGQQDRGRRRGRSAARQQAQVPAEVEVALRQPSWLFLGRPADQGGRGNAVRRGVLRASRPPAYLGALDGIQVGPAGRGGEPGQPVSGQALADERQRRAFDQRVVLQPREQPGRQLGRHEGPAVGVPVRHSREHPPLQLVQRDNAGALGDPHPGQQPQLRGIRQQLDHGQVPEGPDRQPQPEQRRAAADQHLPAERVVARPALGIGPQLDRLGVDPEPPRLAVMDRRRPGRRGDQVLGVAGEKPRLFSRFRRALGHAGFRGAHHSPTIPWLAGPAQGLWPAAM